MPQQPQQSEMTGVFSMESYRNAFGWITLIASVGSVSLEVFLRRGFGSRYLHTQAALAVLLILFWPLFFPDRDLAPMFWFLLAYLFMCARARAARLAKWLRGREDNTHSRYNGRPWLCSLMPSTPELAIKGKIEPTLALCTGIVISGLNEPLGCYLVFAGLCMGINFSVLQARDRARMLDLRDSLIEQQLAVERFREARG